MFTQALVIAVALTAASTANAVTIEVASTGGNATSPYAYGLMFEDINNSGDGGVYAELIQNRAFQGDAIFPRSLDFWNPLGGADLSLQNLSDPLSEALPTSMRVSKGNSSEGVLGFSNVGFWGFPVVEGWQYNGSFWMHGSLAGNVTIALVSLDDEGYAEASVAVSSSEDEEWKQYFYSFTPTVSAPNSNNTLNFTFPASDLSGSVDFNLLSLFPPTYKGRENGLRIDLMEAMGGLNPSFFRAPGGNNVEGNLPPYWWNWTKTLGPLEDRPGYPGTWTYENTDGLGLVEYFLWAQDLGMEMVLGVWSGLWLNGTTVEESGLDVYVQSALDELEFLTGDVSTTWGAKRAAMGYPEPFTVNFVEVGNEDSLAGGGPTYGEYRFQMFYDAIKAVYPHMTIIASFYDVDDFDNDNSTTATPPDDASGDFHEYAIPVQMSSQFGFFDNYTSAHPILIGEYAVVEYDAPNTSAPTWTPGAPRAFAPFWYGSVAEAIFLLGAERNSDKIIGAAYAPTFQNLNRWQWIPDLIQYDAYPGHTTLTTSYEMIRLLSGTRITENLPMEIREGGFGPAYFVAGRSEVTGAHIAKFAVYNSTGPVEFRLSFEGVGVGAMGDLKFLTAPMNATNPIGGSVVETHTEVMVAGEEGVFEFELPEYSVAVLEIGAEYAGYGYGYGHKGGRHGWKGFKDWGHEHGGRNQWGPP